MSWSINVKGTPSSINSELDRFETTLGDDPAGDPKKNLSRYEFQQVKPHLQGLLTQANPASTMMLEANGYASLDHATGVISHGGLNVLLKLAAFLLALLMPALVSAQAPTPAVSYDLRTYNATGTLLAVLNVPIAQWACGQPKQSGGTTADTTNPTRWVINDPANPTTLDCIYNDATRLAALPDGGYQGGIIAVDSAGVRSPESTPLSPFTRQRPVQPLPPLAPTGVRVIR
jgi:hypothetical protein